MLSKPKRKKTQASEVPKQAFNLSGMLDDPLEARMAEIQKQKDLEIQRLVEQEKDALKKEESPEPSPHQSSPTVPSENSVEHV